jgi:hypothetical protein
MSRKHSIIICLFYAGAVIILSSLIFLLPREAISPLENRVLADLPRIDAEAIADGDFAKDFSEFCADRFPLRSGLLKLNASADLALGRLESGGIMRGGGGLLIKRRDFCDLSVLEKNLLTIDEIKRFANERGAKAVFYCAPSGAEVFADFAPSFFDSEEAAKLTRLIPTAAENAAFYRSRAALGDYVYYKTDHHWTTHGAFLAYRALGETLGFIPFSENDFELRRVTNEFFGSSYSASLMPFTKPDAIFAYRYDGDVDVKVRDAYTDEERGLYSFTALESSSKYNFFLGGNYARLDVSSAKGRRLVLIKDSFANSLIPFLARHYDIDLIDPRYLREGIFEVLEDAYGQGSPDLLVRFGADTLVTTELFKK